jgi:hypothetical protein
VLEPGAAELVRALSMLTVMIVGRSDQSVVSGTLVRLLHECKMPQFNKCDRGAPVEIFKKIE